MIIVEQDKVPYVLVIVNDEESYFGIREYVDRNYTTLTECRKIKNKMSISEATKGLRPEYVYDFSEEAERVDIHSYAVLVYMRDEAVESFKARIAEL